MLEKIFSKSPKPIPQNDDLYFCRSDQCLQPRPLKDMKYGCRSCKTEEDISADELPGGLKPTPAIFDSQERCPQHYMPFRPKCPVCGGPIQREDNGQPVRLVAGPHAGKTVYSAVLAREIRRSDYLSRTGFMVQPIGGNDYLHDTVQPLVDQGIVPGKTKQGEPRKIIFRFTRDGAPPRLITLHDMAGEEAPEHAIGYFSDRTLFLVNPQAAGDQPLAGVVPGFVFNAIETLLEFMAGKGALDQADESEVQIFCNLVANLLREKGFPNIHLWNDLTDSVLKTACKQLHIGASFTEEDTGTLAHDLDKLAEGLRRQPDFQTQFTAWHTNMTGSGAHQQDGHLLGHRLALVFAKADLLGESEPQWGRLDAMPPAQASPKEWRRWLEDFSRSCRSELIKLGLENLVGIAERQVEKVGFFFVSSLGRDTEIRVKKIVEKKGTDSLQTSAGQEHMIGGAAPSADQAENPPEPDVKWELSQLVSQGDDGGRSPAPWGIDYPLLWLLLSH